MPKLTFENKITWGNLLTLATIVVGGIITFVTLQGSVVASAKDIDQLNAKVSPISTSVDGLETRMAVVERNQVIGREQREEGQQRTDSTLKEQSEILMQILQTQATILARLDAQDRQM